jgi:hypothetical protein
LFAPASKAQTIELESRGKGAPVDTEKKEVAAGFILAKPFRREENLIGGKASGAYFHKKQFLVLSSAVYAAGIADMHQTMRVRDYSWWYGPAGKTNREAAWSRLLCDRPGARHRSELAELENGALEKMAQACAAAAITFDYGKYARI